MKKSRPLISVIIPVYNTKAFIKKSIDSVLLQTYDNIELIVVNDGSTDGSKELLDNIYQSNSKMIVIHQSNLGVSEARNTGLDLMKGKYFCFLDSDDWLEEDAIEFLYNQIKDKVRTVSMCDRNFVYMRNGDLEIKRQRDSEEPKYFTAPEALLEIGTGKLNLQSSCYKLFPAELINGNKKIRFNKDIHNGEDGLFVFNILNNADGIVFSTEPKWNILERPGSATNSGFNNKILTALYAVDEMLSSSINNPKLMNQIKIYYTERAIGIAISYCLSKNKDKEIKKLLNCALRKFKNVYINSNALTKRKIQYYLLLYMPSNIVYMLYYLKKIIGG